MFLYKRSTFFIALFGAFLLLSSCNEYQKVLKNTDVKAKYDLAERYYNEGDFKRANRLLEQIAPKYVGKPQGERVMFFFADSYFQTKQYYLAGYQFERFVKSYPNSDKIQQATFLEGNYTLVVVFDGLVDPEGSDFYEGWIVRQGENQSVVSTGVVSKKDGVYKNLFISEKDLSDHTFYVLTIEPDDGDPAPADHILEGTLVKQ